MHCCISEIWYISWSWLLFSNHYITALNLKKKVSECIWRPYLKYFSFQKMLTAVFLKNGCIIMQNGCHNCIKICNDHKHTYGCMQLLLVLIKFSNTKLNNDFPFCDADTTNSGTLRKLTQQTLQVPCLLNTRDFCFKTFQHMLMHFWTWHATPNLVVLMWKTPQFKSFSLQVHLLDWPQPTLVNYIQAWHEQQYQLQWKMSANIWILDTVAVCILFQEKDLLIEEFWKINTFLYSVNN